MNWQNKNNRNFQCKFESKCEITIKNRKTCQSCRFKVSCLSQRAPLLEGTEYVGRTVPVV